MTHHKSYVMTQNSRIYEKHVNLLDNIRLPEDVRNEEIHSFLSLNPNHETWGSLKRFVGNLFFTMSLYW